MNEAAESAKAQLGDGSPYAAAFTENATTATEVADNIERLTAHDEH